jgi:cell division protein ZipA
MQADSGPDEAAAEPPEPPPRRGPPEPNWPPEAQRTIISLRVVPRPPARFAGRPLRLAFESCGLEYGAFDIFHLCDDAGEVVASAANLMRPGTFPVETMDAQHFHGVHLFCVLPGPLPPARAVDELIALSRDLAQRLQGLVLDEVGQPLDEERAAEVRARAEGAELAG